MDWNAASKELSKPLDTKHVQPPKKFGPKGDYIEAWHAQAEANRIFGFGGWSQEVIECSCVANVQRQVGRDKKDGWGITYTAKVRIAVGEAIREDFGAGHGYDVDLGLAHESAVKEAVSDAMKRAMKSFGNPFGLALYDKKKANVADLDAETKANSIAIDKINLMAQCESMEELTSFYKTLWNEMNHIATRTDVIAKKDEMKAKFIPDAEGV